jgi:hypothetical protein
MDAQTVFGITLDLLRGAGLILLAHLNEPLNHLILSASFGGYSSQDHEDILYGASFGLGFILAYSQRKRLDRDRLVSQIRVVWAFFVPVLQLLLQGTYESLGPTNGPLLLNILSHHILVLLGTYNAITFLLLADYRQDESRPAPSISNSLGPLSLAGILMWSGILFSPSKLLLQFVSSSTFADIFQPTNLQLLLAGLHMACAPRGGRPMTLMITPFLLGTALFNPHLSNMRLNNRLAAHDWLLVDRAWSTTGYISVLENHSAVYRVLRADHSLLGGEWLLTQERQTQQHWLVPEPTYAVFEMLEAVRLVRSPGGRSPVADGDASALVIGLGIGTAPKALISHGIDTTIVELDPAVHRFAKKWFALPGNHTAVIADAVEWVAGGPSIPDDDSKDNGGGTPLRRFDYIIHDVFTGGASPLSLFTAQFLRDLRARLREDGGVIAINYAGDLSLPLTGHVLGTIERVFDGRRNCRIFRDGPPPVPSSSSSPGEGEKGDGRAPRGGKTEKKSNIDEKDSDFKDSNGDDGKKKNGQRNNNDESHDDDVDNKNSAIAAAAAAAAARDIPNAPNARKETASSEASTTKQKAPNSDRSEADFTNMVIFCLNTASDTSEFSSSSAAAAAPPSWDFRTPVEADYLNTHSRRQYLVPKAEYEMTFPETTSEKVLEVGEEALWAEQQLESARRHWALMRQVVPGVVWDLW